MLVQEIMTTAVETCRLDDDLAHTAKIMWEHDCGCVPVTDADRRVIGMITDRDICMAAYTQGRRLAQISVSSAAARRIHACRPTDTLDTAEAIMRGAQVHRLPVIDAEGRLMGVISLSDLARHLSAQRIDSGLSPENIAFTLAGISETHLPITSQGGSS